MKISDILAQAKDQLDKSGVGNAKLDALILLTHALCVSKEEVIFNPGEQLDETQITHFLNLIKRRENFEPISHIIGKREFYGRDFIVTKDVLDPRPDSESLIELILERTLPLRNEKKITFLEVGSGSGCLSITLLKEMQGSQGTALDISKAALDICDQNSAIHGTKTRLKLIESDVFSALRTNKTPPKFDFIISNPPYIESKTIEDLQPEVRIFEPRMALDGGEDGLYFYRKLACESKEFLAPAGAIFLEIGFGQRQEIENIFIANGFTLTEVKKDLAGVERALFFELNNESEPQ